MIDIVKAEKEFKKYLKNYDNNDDRVKLKTVHTYGVVKASEFLAKELKLDEENYNLAKLIALLHDIGRFEQTKMSKDVYDTADRTFFDHAEYGVKILFEDNLIRNFVAEDKYDNIIYKSILNHNKLKIQTNDLNDNELLHIKIIRDADKIDNFRVKLTESFKVLLGTSDTDIIFNAQISDKVYETFMNEELINVPDAKTCLDRWATYIAFIFDMNFKESLEYLNDNDLVNKCFNRLEYRNPETIIRINNMKKCANDYMTKSLHKLQ